MVIRIEKQWLHLGLYRVYKYLTIINGIQFSGIKIIQVGYNYLVRKELLGLSDAILTFDRYNIARMV